MEGNVIFKIKKIKDFEKYYISSSGHILRNKKKISPAKTPNGYLNVKLSKGGIRSTFLVHRLVAIHFIPNPENKATVNHKNGIKTDNRVENLEWATIDENNKHAIDTGLVKHAKRSKQVDCKVIELIELGIKVREIATQLNISRNTIYRVINSNK